MKLASLLCACVALAGCYGTKSLRLPVHSPSTSLGCGELADKVFFGADYMKVLASKGALVYTPRGPVTAQATLPFTWGIGVWVQHPESAGGGAPCDYELQAVSADPSCEMRCTLDPPLRAPNDPTARNGSGHPSCSLQCPLTPQPGTKYDEATRKMAERLRTHE